MKVPIATVAGTSLGPLVPATLRDRETPSAAHPELRHLLDARRHGTGAAARRAGHSRYGDVRRWLLLVHGATVRPARRRGVRDRAVRGRSREASGLPARTLR